MKIFYVDFRNPVPVGKGEHASLEYWSSEKHAKAGIKLEEKGNWIVLHMDAQADKPAFRIRVPMTNVACIKEREE